MPDSALYKQRQPTSSFCGLSGVLLVCVSDDVCLKKSGTVVRMPDKGVHREKRRNEMDGSENSKREIMNALRTDKS